MKLKTLVEELKAIDPNLQPIKSHKMQHKLNTNNSNGKLENEDPMAQIKAIRVGNKIVQILTPPTGPYEYKALAMIRRSLSPEGINRHANSSPNQANFNKTKQTNLL